MVIAFVHSGRALLPEIAAYRLFFGARGVSTKTCYYGSEHESGADVLWYFMGLFPKAKSKRALVIHEYPSASVPPFQTWKDLLKGRVNPSPDYRLFQSEYVLRQVNPRDHIPFGFRDHGVDLSTVPSSAPEKKPYDFIYIGSCAPERDLGPLLNCFSAGAVKERRLLVLGTGYEKLQRQFSGFGNISFLGPVPPEEIPQYLAQAEFALNYIPDVQPFNRQTSTKLLDYAMARMPIVSSRYEWVLRFEERFGGSYYYLRPDLSNLRWNAVKEFRYNWPDLRAWSWEERMRESGVLSFLKTKFPELELSR